MSTQRQQEQQPRKTLKDIAPRWFESIENKRLVSGELSIVDGRYCIVGEAHGFSSQYHCSRCNGFCLRFLLFVHQNTFRRGLVLTVEDEFYRVCKEFENHWNAKHQQTTDVSNH